MKYKRYFTPHTMQRFSALGRGQGTYENYVPWHRVSRSDPSSRGRSHLQYWNGRQAELLSDRELLALLFSTMLPDVVDIREQFPLSVESSAHELNEYVAGWSAALFPGTLQLAKELEIKHPVVRDDTGVEPWLPTTDILITQHHPDDRWTLIAVAVKPAAECKKPSVLRKLSLEREYWIRRGVQWLLFTEDLYDPLVAATLKCTRPWALAPQSDLPIIQWLCERATIFNGRGLTYILDAATQRWKNKQAVQNAFWRAIWTGQLTFDLRRSWRPSAPFILQTEENFWQRNPIFSGRSAWPA